MTYSAFIAKLRVELKDLGSTDKFIVGDKWSGDGATLVFEISQRPIKDGSYTVLVGGATQTETTHYAVDKDLGFLTFVAGSVPAAGTDNVEMRFKSVKIRDDEYLELINDGIDYFRWKFWLADTDTTTLTTTKDEYELDCSGITGLLWIVDAWYKSSSSSTVWLNIAGLTNVKYDARLDVLRFDPPFDTSDLPVKIFFLKEMTKGATTAATLAMPDEWLAPLKYYVYARFYERIVPDKIFETGAVTVHPSYAPAQIPMMISESYYKRADNIAKKIAPRLPNMMIKNQHYGINM